PRAASILRVLPEEYALSATTASGRVLGRPGPRRGTRMSSRTSTSMAPSLRWPPVSTIASGIPRPSTAAWTLLLSPPRDLPTACPSGSSTARFLRFAPAPCGLIGPGGVGAVLMGTGDRRVHRARPVAVPSLLGLRHQLAMDPVPHPEPGVEVVALPHRLPGAEPVPGQVTP